MSLETLIENYGYIVLFVGTLFEGETIVVIAGFVAHQAYLNIFLVIAVAFLGTILTDQFFFWLGRTKGQDFLAKRPSWQEQVEKIQHILNRYQNLVLLTFRFMYGFRTLTPIIIGMSTINGIRFPLLNIVGGVIWSVTFSLVGYFSGHALEYLLQDIRYIEKEIIAALALVGLLGWMFYFYHRYKKRL